MSAARVAIPARHGTHCIMPDCVAPRLYKRRLCAPHWAMVPGKLRRTLTFQPFTTPITEQLWDQARRAVEQAQHEQVAS